MPHGRPFRGIQTEEVAYTIEPAERDLFLLFVQLHLSRAAIRIATRRAFGAGIAPAIKAVGLAIIGYPSNPKGLDVFFASSWIVKQFERAGAPGVRAVARLAAAQAVDAWLAETRRLSATQSIAESLKYFLRAE